MYYVINYEKEGRTFEQTVAPHEDVIMVIERILREGAKITGLKRQYSGVE